MSSLGLAHCLPCTLERILSIIPLLLQTLCFTEPKSFCHYIPALSKVSIGHLGIWTAVHLGACCSPGRLFTWVPGCLGTWAPVHLGAWAPRWTYGHLGASVPGHLCTWASGYLGTWASRHLGLCAHGHLGT